MDDMNQQLRDAAKRGDLEACKSLLKRGCDIIQADEDGKTPLHIAVERDNEAVVEFLIDHGADVEQKTTKGKTALHLATSLGNLTITKLLLSHGAKMDTEGSDGYNALLSATRYGDLDVIKCMISNGVNVNMVNSKGETALNIAAGYDKLEVLKYLISQGAEVNVTDGNVKPALINGASWGHLEVTKYLISKGAEVNKGVNEGATPLRDAAFNGHLDVIKYLISEGAEVDKGDNEGATPLRSATVNGHLDVIKHLISEGAEVDKGDNEGRTPLQDAAFNGHLDVIKYLISQGAEVNKEKDGGWIPLHHAAEKGHLNVTKYLISQGAQVNKSSNDGRTALYLATRNGHLDVTKYLISEGAEVNRGDNKGRTPLRDAAFDGHLDVIKYLISKGAVVNSEEDGGGIPLHSAAQNGHLDVTKYLISKGAEVDKGDNEGRTPLRDAAFSGHLDVIKYLISKGAEMNSEEDGGWTPLHSAAQNGHLDVTKYLISHRAEVNKGNNNGRTALHQAALEGHLDLTKHLISVGATVNKTTDDGQTALHRAAQKGHYDVTTHLINQGAEYDATDPVYIHLAIQHGGTSIIEKLVSQGADLNTLSTDGQTCLHKAIQLCYKTVRKVEETNTLRKISEDFYKPGELSPEKALVLYLLKNGVKSDVRDRAGNLPIYYARDDVVRQMILSRSTEPVRDDMLDALSNAIPHTLTYPLCNKLLPDQYLLVNGIIGKYDDTDYNKATREVLGIWKDKTGGRSCDLWKILQELEQGGLWCRLIPRQEPLEISEDAASSLSVPPEILARGPRAQQAYTEAARVGTKKVFRTRLMLVGQERVGKTSLKKSLTGQGFDKDEAITDGVETSNACEISVEVAKTGGLMWSIHREEHENLHSKGDEYSKALAEEIAKELIITAKDRKGIEPQPSSKQTDTRKEETLKADDKIPTQPASQAENSQKEQEAARKVGAPKVDDRLPTHLASLVENSLKKQVRTKESGTDSTDGGKDDGLSLSIWDFAGHDVYYTTHQVFLTWRAVYVIVFDLSRSLDSVLQPECRNKEFEKTKRGEKSELTCLEFINFWLCSIYAHAVAPDSVSNKNTGETAQKSPPIFIVGTHRECIKGNPKEKRKKIDSAFDAISKIIKKKPFQCHVIPRYYAIENSLDDNDEELIALRKHIEKVVIEEPYMGEEIPLRWLKFEEALAADNTNYMSLDKTKELTRPVGIESENELLTMLTFYHDLGYIVYFGNMVEHQSLLRDIVILNPQWLIDVFKQVITILEPAKREGIVNDAWSILEEDGILEDRLIQHMWQGFLEQKAALVELMAKFDLICEVPVQRMKQKHEDENGAKVSEVPDKSYYVPSRLTSTFPEDEMEHIKSSTDFYVDFKGFLPDGLFHRLMTRTVVWMGEQKFGQPVSLFHRHISLMADEDHCALLKMLSPNEATIKVTVFRPDDAESDDDDVSSDQRAPAPSAVKEVMDFVTQTLESLRLHWAKRIKYDVCFACPKCGVKKLFKDCFKQKSIKCGPGIHMIRTASIRSKFGLVQQGIDSADNESQMIRSRQKTRESRILSDIYLSDLAQKIDSEWQLLGIKLCLTRTEINHIKEDEQTAVDRRLAMLQLWRQRFSSGVDMRKMTEDLCKALNKCGRTDLEEEIREDAGFR